MDAGKQFACDICAKAFRQKIQMITHRRIHTGEKPFHCDKCEKTFNQKSVLVRHKRVHTGEKPFQCDICQTAFTQKGDLTKHKRVHTGEKPFHCDLCEKVFTTNVNLTVHKRVHTGEKPYICEICDKSFISKSHLNNHNKSIFHLKRINFHEIHIKEEVIEREINNPSPLGYYTETDEKQVIKEEVKESDEGQDVEDSDLDSKHLVDCSKYVQVQINT